MKTRGLVLGVLCLGVVLSLGIAARAQAPENQLIWVSEFVVEPARSAEFEAVVKDWLAFYVEIKYPWSYTIYRTEDFHYYLLSPIKDMAGLEEMMKTDMELAAKGGPKYEALLKRSRGSYSFMNNDLVVLRYDLSYLPEPPRVSTQDARFICWDYYYGLPGMEKESEQIAKDWQALYKSKNIPDGFLNYMLIMGPDMPLTVGARWGKDAADFNAADEFLRKTAGDAYTALADKTMALCRKYERRLGYLLEALSYWPQTK